jgi:actin related protein 2/3 complex subunit 1A/1B
VHTVSFSPSGDVLAFACQSATFLSLRHNIEYVPKGHDSTISIVYPGSGPAIRTVRITTLPLVTLVWASEDSIVAAGHDCQPYVFSGNEGGWTLIGSLDDTSAPKSTLSPSRFGPGGPGRLNSSAFNTFKNADSRGIGGGGASSQESELLTVHQNTITSVRPYEGESGAVTKVSTTGVDGKLVIWNVATVTALTAKLGSAHLR